ncbi:MAG: hypothetical protein EOP83_26985 [Verrucomicrobiaceae bacterium]|nr:MAG: hypothetical protein EOP83_26985 [Verrucomicrobiaceae bacterium]
MDDIEQLARQIDREKIERARSMSLSEKFLAGAELFEDACEVTRFGIRRQNPHWNDEQVEAELVQRLDIGRRIESALAR